MKDSRNREPIRILFIVPYPTEGPSNRFRIEQYLPAVEEGGFKATVRPFCNSEFYGILHKKGRYLKKIASLIIFSLRRLADVFHAADYNIVFIHREAFPDKSCVFEWFFSLLARKIIYDFDDAVFLTKPLKIKMLLKKAHHVITGNKFLRDYSLRFNQNVTVLPTPIDTDKYLPAVSNTGKRKVVIGWIGTSSTSAYLLDLLGVFKRLSERHKNIEFRIVGGDEGLKLGIAVNRMEWSLASETRELQGFDIGIMPMPDNNWTKGKCAFKIIQYMAVGIPSVASPVGMSADIINDGQNGFLASTEAEWIDRLSRLIDSPGLRETMGKEGRHIAEEAYSLKVNAPKLLKIFEKVLAGRP